MEYTIQRAKIGDEAILAHIQTESWKDGFKDILNSDTLTTYTNLDKATAMYRRLLTENIGNGYILSVNGSPHCIAWWDKTRENDMPGYAELICIHSLKSRWRQGFGRLMMKAVLEDVKKAGYSNIMLWVFEENVRARSFYEMLGFAFNGKKKTEFEATEVCYEMLL